MLTRSRVRNRVALYNRSARRTYLRGYRTQREIMRLSLFLPSTTRVLLILFGVAEVTKTVSAWPEDGRPREYESDRFARGAAHYEARYPAYRSEDITRLENSQGRVEEGRYLDRRTEALDEINYQAPRGGSAYDIVENQNHGLSRRTETAVDKTRGNAETPEEDAAYYLIARLFTKILESIEREITAPKKENFLASPSRAETPAIERFDSSLSMRKEERAEPAPVTLAAPMENIFEPRPQIISYVLSPARQTEQDIGVASIEVLSELPHHKIRHHHGQKSRRDRRRSGSSNITQ